MALQEEMLAIVLKDLPNQTAGVLKTYLDEAEKTKKLLDPLKKANDELHSNNTRMSKEITDLTDKLKTQDELDKKILDLEKRERDLLISLLKAELSSYQRENYAVIELTKTVFKNPSYTRHERNNIPVATQGSGNCSGFVANYNETKTITESIE